MPKGYPDTITCPQCKEGWPAEFICCPMCGTRMRKPKEIFKVGVLDTVAESSRKIMQKAEDLRSGKFV